MFTLGVPEMAVIFILALVLFGPKKLPELGRTIGKAMTEFRRASNDLKATFEREMHTLERENQSIQATTRETAREIADHVSYDIVPSDTMWNPLEGALNDVHSAVETATTQELPAPVGASEVSGAESTLAAESAPALPSIKRATEGTISRSGSMPRPSRRIQRQVGVPETKNS
jgi:sec-independent protein translocase protein TatA